MQVQENRTATGATADPFSANYDAKQSFARPGTYHSTSLFAEIFNSFATSAPAPPSPPPPNSIETPNGTAPAAVTEPTQTKDEDDQADEKVDQTGLASYALPLGPQPVLADTGDIPATKDLGAQSAENSLIGNSDTQPQLANKDASLPGNAAQVTKAEVPKPAVLAQSPVAPVANDVTNAGEVPVDPNQNLGDAPENQGAKVKQAKPSPESTDSTTPVSQDKLQSTSRVGDSSTDPSAKGSEAVAPTDPTRPDSIAIDGSQSSDRGDGRRRNDDSDRRASNVDRQESSHDSSKDPAIASASPVNGSLESQSLASAAGFSSVDTTGNTAAPTVSQVAIAAASSLAGTPLGASSRAASGSVTQGTPSVSGPNSAGSNPRILQGSSDSASADTTSSSRRSDIADRARLVHRIAKAFQKMGVDSGQVRLRMHPDELGGVQIEMQVDGRSVKAKVTADGEEARQLLQDSLPELRQRLESQGLTVERLDVELRSESERSSLMNQNHQQHQSSGSNDEAARRDGVWRRPAEARSELDAVAVAKPELKQTVRSVGSERSLDLKV